MLPASFEHAGHHGTRRRMAMNEDGEEEGGGDSQWSAKVRRRL